MLTIDQLCKKAYKMAKAKGFDASENIHRSLMLIVGELAEAQEELRTGHAPNQTYYEPTDDPRLIVSQGYLSKPLGFPSELADAMIRIADLAHSHGIDLEEIIVEKMAYNATRPHKHGKAF